MSPKPCRGGHKDRVRLGQGQRPWVTLAVFDMATAVDRFERLALMSAALVASGKASEAPRLMVDAAQAAPDERAFAGVERFVRDLCREPGDMTGPVTFRQLCDDYTSGELKRRFPKYVEKKGKTDATRKKEKARLALLCKTLGDMPVADITVEDADRAMRLLPEGSGDSWRRAHEQPLFHLMGIACFPMRLIESNPIPSKWVTAPSEQRETTILYPDEDAVLMASGAVNRLDERLYWGIQCREGFRPGGAALLRWVDFDLDRGVVRHKHKTKHHRVWVLDEGVVRALRAWRELNPDEFVFPRHARMSGVLTNAAPDLRAGLLRARVLREALHVVATDELRPIEAHGLRASFVTVALADGRTEHWVMDRTGHTTSDQISIYKKLAHSLESLELGWYGPLDVLLGLTAASQPLAGTPRKPAQRVGQKAVSGLFGVGQRVGQISINTEQNAGFKTTCCSLKASATHVKAPKLVSDAAPTRTKRHGKLTQAHEGGSGFAEGGSGSVSRETELTELLALATKEKRWPLVRSLGAQLEEIARAKAVSDPKVTSLDAARRRRGK